MDADEIYSMAAAVVDTLQNLKKDGRRRSDDRLG
jgi:hypothetical protein